MADFITPGTVVFKKGAPVTSVYIILKGSLKLDYESGFVLLKKGDAAGLIDLYSGTYSATCTVSEDAKIAPFPIRDASALTSFLRESPDSGPLLLRSVTSQFNELNKLLIDSMAEAGGIYATFTEYYDRCRDLFQNAGGRFRGLTDASELNPETDGHPFDQWVQDYYSAFPSMLDGKDIAFPPRVCAGLIFKTGQDFAALLPALHSVSGCIKDTLNCFMNEELEDLFDRYCTVYMHTQSADALSDMLSILELLESTPLMDKELLRKRKEDFESFADPSLLQKAKTANAPVVDLPEGLFSTLVSYSGFSSENAKRMSALLDVYAALDDPFSSDEKVASLRKELTSLFFTLYKACCFVAFEDKHIPDKIKLFLYFGCVTEKSITPEDAAAFLELTKKLGNKNRPANMYTLYDWLYSIYREQNEPSRDEFEVDYTDYVRKLASGSKITKQQESELMSDSVKKVEYELDHMVRTVMKMTFGRVTAFCPVFHSKHLVRRANDSFVEYNRLETRLEEIRSVDFSAYYREYLYSDETKGVPKEYLHTEVLPNIILMPVAGTRSIMWQEIEGRKRTTAARMFLPIFYQEDLKIALIRMTGEYRWEMCKRIQGSRWNDVTDPSLTGEYFDYIQFYKKNHDLSAEAKEKIKAGLSKVHNGFREMFILDYTTYMLFESGGSPRMNKVARGILFKYCPFSSNVRRELSINPLYKDITERYATKNAQELYRLSNLERKLVNAGKEVPAEILNEEDYYKK